MTEDLQERYATKIAALLSKAESTTPEEAELLLEKAQQLMSRYAIEQAMVDKARGVEREKIVEKRVEYKGSYYHGLMAVGHAIAEANGCRVLQSKRKNRVVMYVIGFESDVERSIMLDSSVQIQMQTALRAAVRRGDVRSESWMTAMQKFKERRQFMFGFAQGVATRLDRAAGEGRDEYLQQVVREGGDEEETSTGMELIIRSRKDQINDWVDRTYGKLRTVRGTLAGGSGRASRAGHEAGLSADTGSSGALGKRKALTR